MRNIVVAIGATLAVGLAPQFAAAYSHSNRAGGSTSHEAGQGTEHTNAYGGSSEHAYGGGSEHTNMYGGSTEGRYGDGASHTNVYGGTTSAEYGHGAYHSTPYGATAYPPPPPGAYAYHPPTTVNYYGAGCYNCGGYSTAGAVAAGVVVGAAVGAAAAESASTTTTTTTTTTTYVVGNVYPALPSGCATPDDTAPLLPLWQHLVPAELRCQRRVLQGGDGTLNGHGRRRAESRHAAAGRCDMRGGSGTAAS